MEKNEDFFYSASEQFLRANDLIVSIVSRLSVGIRNFFLIVWIVENTSKWSVGLTFPVSAASHVQAKEDSPRLIFGYNFLRKCPSSHRRIFSLVVWNSGNENEGEEEELLLAKVSLPIWLMNTIDQGAIEHCQSNRFLIFFFSSKRIIKHLDKYKGWKSNPTIDEKPIDWIVFDLSMLINCYSWVGIVRTWRDNEYAKIVDWFIFHSCLTKKKSHNVWSM